MQGQAENGRKASDALEFGPNVHRQQTLLERRHGEGVEGSSSSMHSRDGRLDRSRSMRGSWANAQGVQQVMGHERKMPLKDKISLGPIEKYTLYNRFPYKLLLHLALLILTSIQISTDVQSNQAQLRSQQYVWYTKFMWNGANGDDDPVPTMGDFNRERRFFTVGEVTKFATTSLENYYSLKDKAEDEFEDYDIVDPKTNKVRPAQFFAIDMDGGRQQATAISMDKPAAEGGAWPGPLGKSVADFKVWLRDIREFQISYPGIQIKYPASSGHDRCYAWDVTQRYYHTERPQVRVALEMHPSTCSTQEDSGLRANWVTIMTILCAAASCALELLQILETVKILRKLREVFEKKKEREAIEAAGTNGDGPAGSNSKMRNLQKLQLQNQAQTGLGVQNEHSRLSDLAKTAAAHEKLQRGLGNEYDADEHLTEDMKAKKARLMKEANWEDLLFWDKFRLFDVWSIVSILANLCQILGCGYSLFRNQLDISTADKNLGLGCMLAWWVMLRYLLKTQAYRSMLASFQKSAPYIGRALISMIPLFIGYAFLGMAIFWESRRFANFTVSCYTLFALMHGDMIFDTYNDMIQIDNLVAQLYLYSYIFISVCVIVNIFTIIIEEGFMKQKYDNDYTWLHKHTRKHLGMDDEGGPGSHQELHYDNDGINVDSDVIVSEYRLLYLKYKEQIRAYKDAIANLSLKQIINNEEEAWVEHRTKLEQQLQQQNQANTGGPLLRSDSTVPGFLEAQNEKRAQIRNLQTYEFDLEIQQLTQQLKEKIASLKKDYRDLKIFKNQSDIQSAREKLLVFVRKLIADTDFLVRSIQTSLDANEMAIERAKEADQDRLAQGRDNEDTSKGPTSLEDEDKQE